MCAPQGRQLSRMQAKDATMLLSGVAAWLGHCKHAEGYVERLSCQYRMSAATTRTAGDAV